MSTYKTLLLGGLTVASFIYIVEGTTHELQIPQEPDGIAIHKINDIEISDKINNFLKIPLQDFPRTICLANNNRVYSDNIEVPRDQFPEAGTMNIFVEKNHDQLIRGIHAAVGEIKCEPIDFSNLEGATTTANYVQAAYVNFKQNSDGSITSIGAHPIEGGFQSDIRVDVSNSHLSVDLSPISRLVLLFLTFLTVSVALLAVFDLTKRISAFLRE